MNTPTSNSTPYGLHIRLSLIIPATIPRPLPAQLDADLTVPPTATVAEIDQAVKSITSLSITSLLDSYAQAVTAGREEPQT